MAKRSQNGLTAALLAERHGHASCAREMKDHCYLVAEERRALKAADVRNRADRALDCFVEAARSTENDADALKTLDEALAGHDAALRQAAANQGVTGDVGTSSHAAAVALRAEIAERLSAQRLHAACHSAVSESIL